MRILKFLKKAETDQKYEEMDLKIRGNHSTINWETDTKYSEIPLQF